MEIDGIILILNYIVDPYFYLYIFIIKYSIWLFGHYVLIGKVMGKSSCNDRISWNLIGVIMSLENRKVI